MAAQGRDADRRRCRDRREGRRHLHDASSACALLREEYDKLQKAGNRDVHDDSKTTTLPIAREIVETYLLDETKLPWYIDLLNITLGNHDLNEAKAPHQDCLADAFSCQRYAITAKPRLLVATCQALLAQNSTLIGRSASSCDGQAPSTLRRKHQAVADVSR